MVKSMQLLPRSLTYLEAVAREGSIQGASRSLGIAASAINRHILALEAECQMPLFERKPRGMVLTAAGETAVLLARRWRADQERLTDAFRSMRGVESGTVRLAGMDSLSNSILPACVHKVAETNPGIHLSIDIMPPQQAARDLEEGLTDLALAFNLPPDKHRHVLWTASLPFGCLVGPGHALWDRKGVALKDVASFPIAAQSRVLPVRQYLDRSHSWIFEPTEPVLVTNSPQLLKQVLRQGQHLTITSQMDAILELLSGDLRFIRLSDTTLKPQSLSLVLDPRRNLSHASRKVADVLTSLLRDFHDRLTASQA
ncbi:LysR family transcriptional regulator [Jannaschia pohangensis]|uniref:DNA-binding transcriptional regulator, LysR family n=1 Tax=Jannaschia pohangensis TaxID=390807 RepID=A0A1I3GXP1_9RHOB|nr:LysR family transcriptional regulator [Jannaschia pohangensis]SFI28151.1 DNA-binding transcriptional regulator, LysR family [Jannaschia pohangensis]